MLRASSGTGALNDSRNTNQFITSMKQLDIEEEVGGEYRDQETARMDYSSNVQMNQGRNDLTPLKQKLRPSQNVEKRTHSRPAAQEDNRPKLGAG